MSKFHNPRTDIDVMVEGERLSEGHGADYYEITEDHIKQWRAGHVYSFDSQGEYSVFVRLKPKHSDFLKIDIHTLLIFLWLLFAWAGMLMFF